MFYLSRSIEAEILQQVQWKPLMSETDAERYTRDSYYAGRNFYHGTGKEAANGIVSEGARLTADVVNSYGDGLYLAFDRDAAIDYANQSLCPTLLTAKVSVKNPKKFIDSLDVESFLDENNILFDDLQSTRLTKILKKQGFDAIEVGGNRILVIIFAKQQIAVFQTEEI
jgi:hypothetical protein